MARLFNRSGLFRCAYRHCDVGLCQLNQFCRTRIPSQANNHRYCHAEEQPLPILGKASVTKSHHPLPTHSALF